MPQINEDFFAAFFININVFLSTLFTFQEFLTNERIEILLLRTGIPEKEFPAHVKDNPILNIFFYNAVAIAAFLVCAFRIAVNVMDCMSKLKANICCKSSGKKDPDIQIKPRLKMLFSDIEESPVVELNNACRNDEIVSLNFQTLFTLMLFSVSEIVPHVLVPKDRTLLPQEMFLVYYWKVFFASTVTPLCMFFNNKRVRNYLLTSMVSSDFLDRV